jgi:hypothetical protein
MSDRTNDFMRQLKARILPDALRPDLFKAHGYELWHTGGGCTAWGKKGTTPCQRFESEAFVMVTDDLSIPDKDTTEFTVGIYNDADDEGTTRDFVFDSEGALYKALLWAELELEDIVQADAEWDEDPHDARSEATG